jgi:uncharacterized membrane protein
MGILLLILGVALWSGAHLFKRLAPARRASMGEGGKGLVTALLLVSIVLMVLGYRWAETTVLWQGPAFLTHVNNLLMLLVFYLFAASGMKTGITRVIRHPQLTAVKTWAVAHLLVNGSVADVILFGGLLAWAVVSVILINRANRDWTRPAPAGPAKEAIAAGSALVLLYLVGTLHGWLGVWPYGG